MKVLAKNITNLTDARYFASRFVDVMAIPWKGGQQDHELWQAVKTWIDGVLWSLEVEHASSDLKSFIKANNIEHCVVRDNPIAELPEEVHQWVLVESQSGLSQLVSSFRHPPRVSIIVTYSWVLNHSRDLEMSNIPVWLEINSPEEVLKLKNDSIYVEGLALTGSPEEETGMKSYEMMDTIFEAIDLSWPESL